ncbi:winged helix DNA-binding domain-containing protein [Agromyces bauzanensis]
MDLAELRRRRLRVQGLRSPSDVSAPEVVRRFVAVQAQEYLPAQWGLAMRVPADRRPDATSVAAAIDAGEILRTHVLRPTWHFVAPADARWLVELSGPRVRQLQVSMLRSLGLDGAEGARGVDVVARALEGGHRTRAELGRALGEAGFPASGLGMIYVLMLAELERVAISGADVGRQRTYAAFDERVPASAPRPREEALAELAGRYLAARGPAGDRDFASWSGFTLTECRRAIADAVDGSRGRLVRLEVDGVEHWFDDEAADSGSAEHTDERGGVDLLQAYDEYVMGYAAPREYLFPPGRSLSAAPEFPMHAVVSDGVLAGRWAPVVAGRAATVKLSPWRAFSRAEERSLAASVTDLERFLGVPVTVQRLTE